VIVKHANPCGAAEVANLAEASLISAPRRPIRSTSHFGKIGRVGYEINFNRYFYKYIPPRPLAYEYARQEIHCGAEARWFEPRDPK
jgi:hypothetical protein